MRTRVPACATVGLALAAGAGLLRGESGEREAARRVAGLIRQLGDDRFAARQAASRELAAAGEVALPALGKATGDDDPEIRRRAERLIAQIGHRLERTDVKSVPPPKGAIVLFNGKSLDAWVGRDGKTRPAWKIRGGGVLEACEQDIRTRKTFPGGYRLHVEFRVPSMPDATGQGRGNSGVYVHGRYEVQILDSHGQEPDVQSCGAIYGLAAPRVNACKPPEVWQSYDIDFEPPRFERGVRVQAARLTVSHNGVLIHDKAEVVADDTGLGLPNDPARPGPVMLQYHGSPVQFRNVWLLPKR